MGNSTRQWRGTANKGSPTRDFQAFPVRQAMVEINPYPGPAARYAPNDTFTKKEEKPDNAQDRELKYPLPGGGIIAVLPRRPGAASGCISRPWVVTHSQKRERRKKKKTEVLGPPCVPPKKKEGVLKSDSTSVFVKSRGKEPGGCLKRKHEGNAGDRPPQHNVAKRG